MKYLVALGLVACAGIASAQFYGGDPDHINGLVSSSNSIADAQTFDDFSLGATTQVTSLYGNYYFTNAQLATSASYEIRTGMSVGNGGTLVASGTVAAVSVLNGINDFGLTGYTVSVVTNFTLGPGTYWMTLTPDMGGSALSYLDTTSGANGVGGPLFNGNSFFNSAVFGVNYGATGDQLGGTDGDFSYGLVGTQVPEPASLAALGLGAIAAIRRRRASKK